MPQDIYAAMQETVVRALRSVVPDLTDDIIARVEVLLALRPVQLEQVRLGDAHRSGDRFGRGAGIAALGELVERRNDDRVAPLVGRLAGGRCAAFMAVT